MRKLKLNLPEITTSLTRQETSALRAAKNMLLQEQKGIDIEQLVQDISLGYTPLLTAGVIAERIGVSLDLFHQWVRNENPSSLVSPPISIEGGLEKMLFNNLHGEDENVKFPNPDLYLGDSPRWTLQTFQN